MSERKLQIAIEPRRHSDSEPITELTGFDVETYEYECGHPCTPDGCMGHSTNIPVSFEVSGVRFVVNGYEGGDFPGRDKDEIDRVIEVVNLLGELIE